MKLKWIVMITMLLLPLWAVAADVQHEASAPLIKTVEIDGYSVSYYMKRAEGNYHLVVKVKQDGKAVELLRAVAKVITSDGQALMQKMKKSEESYISKFDLKELGQNQLMIQFKTPDKKKHFIGGWYPGMEQ